MQATMAIHPRDAGLPRGAVDPSQQLAFPHISGESTASTIMSPLSLPHGVSGYFDYPVTNRVNHDGSPAIASAHRVPRSTGSYLNASYPAVYSPLSPGARGPPVPQSTQFLSPNLHPITQGMQYQIQQHNQQQQQQRSASMSPTRRMSTKAGTLVRSRSTTSRPTPGVVSISPPAINGMPPGTSDYMSNGTIPAITAASAGHPRSVSEGAAGSQHHVQMVRRLVQQNGRIREAWEAERKYMEANRERVEEVYKEERALMEEERAEWEYEKEALLKKIELLQQQVAGLCGYRGSKNDVSARGKTKYGAGSDWNMSPESMRSSASSQGSALPGPRNGGLPGSGDVLQRLPSQPRQPISDAASLASHPTNFGQNAALRFSPSRQYESSPFIPMTANNGMASPPAEDATPVPIVDVQEIIPTSEGIPIKASAVQRTTFSDGPSSPPASKPTSRTPSPPADTSKLGGKPVKEQTLQVLAADEVDRLTMHAGHTPNHSLSVMPTVTATTASSSGESTPTLQHGDMIDSSAATSSSDPLEPPNTRKSETSEDHGTYPEEAMLDAGPEDAPLRGPLMVRNMPAHDEIFFQQLSDKLEEVSKGTKAAVPAVLRDVVDDEESTDTKPTIAVDDTAAEKGSESSPRSRESQETDIPLKLKRNNNFGAPFGEYR
ncbi:hypothetical protein CONLIGDRAFT_287286 [Coniochaeta ligniaria NRRL 30616]|uniref:Uncharacterized protein n=1 Tax=Coniochaeta ligniaria NRRL 30616 TaxID=1408157 RepID=A0A1J7IT49_9PEZI|nr:hypothetical protein CONLIGDRAFT_287286 [Coniochaeta ligniaria NRRL 30616]